MRKQKRKICGATTTRGKLIPHYDPDEEGWDNFINDSGTIGCSDDD